MTTDNAVAIILHLFYPDLWEEVHTYLAGLNTPHDLYITVPPQTDDAVLHMLLRDRPDARVYITENRGRDVLPFLLVTDLFEPETYDYICKLHSKKTGESPLGHIWRKLLYYDLIGSPETVTSTLEMFEKHPEIGQITGKYTILDSERYAYGNNTKIRQLCEMSGIPFSDRYIFAGGTMFWTRSTLLAPLLTLFREGNLDFEEERGQKDHTVAHAIERFFGLILKAREMTIAPSPSDYAKLPAKTVEETAALVLSQQYAGQDVYEKINELNDYVQELEALAESMRLKNRLKRLPSDLVRITSQKLFPQKKGSDDPAPALPTETRFTLPSLRVFNAAALKKALYYLKRGEIRFMLRRIKEKLLQSSKLDKSYQPLDPKSLYKPFDIADYVLPDTRIDIIIPVYNGLEFLPSLFDGLAANTSHPYRLVVIEDASPDAKVRPYLKERLSEFSDVLLLENETNLGFVQSVLRAVKKVQGHFVILNTDTEVPPFWLQRLMHPIFNRPNTASTTPFTNAGTIASFPHFLKDNPLFENLDLALLDACFQSIDPKPYYAEIPTGVGFCMGVNHDLVKEIGFFDAEAFGKGYGEENDWCQRAIEHGYTNLLVPNLFVYHKHGGSFPSEVKQKLLEQNHLKLLERHPDYDRQIQSYIQKDPHKVLREVLVLHASSLSTPLWLMFDHGLGGGANHYADQKISQELESGHNTLFIRYDFYGDRYLVHHRYKAYEGRFSVETLDDLDAILSRLNIGTLFLNSLVSYPNSKEILEYLLQFISKKHPETIIPIHDFYAVCPSYTLLNDKGEHCGIPSSTETCRACIANNQQEWKTFHPASVDIDTWRTLWNDLLQHSSSILCFSNNSKMLLHKAYSDVSDDKIAVIPHQIDDIETITPTPRSDNDPVTIGILGAINHAKGAAVIKDLVTRIESQNLPFRVVVIGEITEPIQSGVFTVTGKYAREELPLLIRKHAIDLFLIPSIWPETFSYTTEEIMQMGLPLMVFDIGAPAERVRHYEKGMIIPEISADAVLQSAQAMVKDAL